MSHRYAEKEDLPQVYSLYLDALDELGEEYDERDAMDFVLQCWAKAPCILLLKDDQIIGFAGLTTYSPQYNKTKAYLRDYMFYIAPAHRGIKSWRTLCKAVQETADRFKLTFVGEHRISADIPQHIRMIRLAGATPKAILSVYGDN